MSNSPRVLSASRPHHDAGVIHQPRKSQGAGRRLHFLPPSKEGAERRSALRIEDTLEGATCRLSGTRASRRSTVAFLGSGPLFRARADEHNLAPIQAALALPFSPSTSSP